MVGEVSAIGLHVSGNEYRADARQPLIVTKKKTIRNWRDGEIERPTALPEFLTCQFKHDYRRHLRNLSRAS